MSPPELDRRIEERRDELIELTQALVRIPTVNPPGEEYEACARLLAHRLERRGWAVQVLHATDAPGCSERYPRTNVVARLEGRAPGPCVHFNGHIDVVEPGSGWTFDPFAAVLEDGRIYGRGTCDMKGGLAAAIIALESIQDSGVRFGGALEISGTVDEETGGFAGVAWLAEQGLFSKPRIDHVIIPEPLDVDRVCIGHRGVWWSEVETFGRIAHGSMPFLGDCAIRHMSAFMGRIEHELMPRLASRQTALPVVPEAARHATLNLTRIHGGQPDEPVGLASPLVADSCRVLLDRRILAEEDPGEVRAELVALLDQLGRERRDFRYRIRDVMEVPPVRTRKGAPVIDAVAHEIRRVLAREPALVASPGTYDQKHISRIGGLDDCIAYGPGRLELAHQPDEYVLVEDLVASAKVMAGAALVLLGAAA